MTRNDTDDDDVDQINLNNTSSSNIITNDSKIIELSSQSKKIDDIQKILNSQLNDDKINKLLNLIQNFKLLTSVMYFLRKSLILLTTNFY